MKSRWILAAALMLLLQSAAIARQPNEELSSISERERSLGPANITQEEVESDIDGFWDWLMNPDKWFAGADRSRTPATLETEAERM